MHRQATLSTFAIAAVVVIVLLSAAPAMGQCNGSPGGWVGCRGNGCAVCTEMVTNYPLYFQNHPLCSPNSTCAGLHYTCNAACPAPGYADQCNGSPGGWVGCRGNGCAVCTEMVTNYPLYFQNHPLCSPNSTCNGLHYTCNANCPAPTEADRFTCTVDTCGSCYRPSSVENADVDGIPDQLEYDLAYKYFPNVLLQHLDTDLLQTYVYSSKSIPYTVEPYGPAGICNESLKCLQIKVGLAYFNDTGDPTWGGGHPGDSEFYAVLVMRTTSWSNAQYTADNWQMIRDFTAAHWRTDTDSSMYGEYGSCPPPCGQWDNDEQACHAAGRCIWFPGLCIGGAGADYQPCSYHSDEGSCFFAGGSCQWIDSDCGVRSDTRCYSSLPRTARWTGYAAEGKHGLYHTDSECDGGGVCVPFFGCSDECPNNTYNMRDYISGLLQNVGNCTNHGSFDTTIQDPDNCRLYNVWGGTSFGESTAYQSHLCYSLSWDVP